MVTITAGNKPLPKQRPGKQGVSKLWTPGSPLTKPSAPPPAVKQPVKLLQRGGLQAKAQPTAAAKTPAARLQALPQPQVVTQVWGPLVYNTYTAVWFGV